jgi:hypothetical protein
MKTIQIDSRKPMLRHKKRFNKTVTHFLVHSKKITKQGRNYHLELSGEKEGS